MLVEILLAVVCLIAIFWEKLFPKIPKDFPPGPFRFPIAGHLPLLGKDPLRKLDSWSDQYGKIVGLRFGDFDVVMLSDYNFIKEAFDRPEFNGRPKLGPFILIAGENRRGLVVQEGRGWSEQRRFALRNLRDFGFGKKSMEGTIQEDVTELVETLKKLKGTPISTQRRLSLVVLSALWNIIAGEKFAHDDPKFQSVLDSLNAVFSTTSISGPVFFLPWLAKLAPSRTGWLSFSNAISKVKALIGGVITDHKNSHDQNHPRDFMDVFLNEINNTEDPESSFYQNVGDENMLVSMMNLFGAGAETTSNTLSWSFYLLAKHPQVQQKMFQEIEKVVGTSRLPSVDDRSKLVYTEAVMTEIFRNSSIVPLGVFHSTMEDVTFHGYSIPKGTAVMANLYAVHHDKKVWGDPEAFRPERFIGEDGISLEKVGHVIPFSVGKRACLGETLARVEFFLFLTSVIQTFEISFDPSTAPNEVENAPSLFRFPPPFKVAFTERTSSQQS